MACLSSLDVALCVVPELLAPSHTQEEPSTLDWPPPARAPDPVGEPVKKAKDGDSFA